jgi:hypothetical protein
MTVQDLVVIVGALALSGALAWFFFGPRIARAAELVGDVQQVRVTVTFPSRSGTAGVGRPGAQVPRSCRPHSSGAAARDRRE